MNKRIIYAGILFGIGIALHVWNAGTVFSIPALFAAWIPLTVGFLIIVKDKQWAYFNFALVFALSLHIFLWYPHIIIESGVSFLFLVNFLGVALRDAVTRERKYL